MGTYLLTGAAGFIASRVAELLLADGHTVVGLDNLCDAYDVRLKHYRLDRLRAREGFRFYLADVADSAQLEDCFRKNRFDAVINLAARAGVRYSVEHPQIFVSTNLVGTLNLLECCQRHQVSKFILASTSSIYGKDAPLPTPETACSDFPLQPYAASKKAAEVMCHAYHHIHGLDVTVFRYFTVYGPSGRPDMVMFRFTQWIAEGRPVYLNGDGTQSRGFTYVDDIARGTLLGLKPLGYEIINLGGHEVITINEMIRQLEARLGKAARVEYRPFHKADMTSNQADITKATSLLGWRPQVGLQEGMGRLVDWYLAERAWAKDVITD